MKNVIKNIMCIVFCLFASASLLIACAQTAGRVQKSAAVPELERYEDKAIGFSIEYDAEKLTEDPGPNAPFVFIRKAAEGMPSLGITAGPYPSGTALEGTTDLITSSLPRIIPGSIVHQVNNQQRIKLTDGTEAHYFEMDWYIDGMESIIAVVAAKNNDRLIVFGAADRKDGSMEDLTAMVKSMRFDVEVDEAALMAKGFGKDGKFVRTDSPAFELDYPKTFQNRPLLPNQVFRAGIPQGSPAISIAISSLMAGKDIHRQLETLAEEYANSLWRVGNDIKIMSQNPIKNYKQFDAYQIHIVWRYRGQTPLTTVVHLIAKGDKAIRLAGHTVYGTDELMDIFKTINLSP